jgi:predicted porin
MRNAILAAMALSAAAAQTAPAQTEDPSTGDPVTMYGRVYGCSTWSRPRVANAAARAPQPRLRPVVVAGVRGTENLGGGVDGVLPARDRFFPGCGGGSFAQRNSAVGLQHASWGSLSMGRWDMPFKLTQVAVVDPFTDLSIADITGTAINQGNFSNREPNIVQYWSPEWAGFTLRAAYAANEARTAVRNPYKAGGSLSYGRGDYYIAYAYEKQHDYSDGTATTGVSQVGNGIAGYFRLGTAKIMGQYGTYTKTNAKTRRDGRSASTGCSSPTAICWSSTRTRRTAGPTTWCSRNATRSASAIATISAAARVPGQLCA